MILQSLKELSLREGLVDDPAFESKPVRWVIDLKMDGAFRGVSDTNVTPAPVEGKKGKPKPQAKMMLIPRRAGRTSGVASDFVVDNAKYVLGIDEVSLSEDAKTQARHRAFVQLLQHAQEEAHEPLLQAVLTFLKNPEAMARAAAGLAEQGGFASNDLFTFRVDGELLHSVESLRAWWSRQLAAPNATTSDSQCLLCGEKRQSAGNHALLQIRGGVTSGVPLVSFNAGAFEKYGWSGTENAPFCKDCMMAYTEALRRLTRLRYVIGSTGETVSPLATVLNGDTTAVYWSDAESPLVSSLPNLQDNPKQVADLLQSPHKGIRVHMPDAARFYCLILSGAQGRAIVRKMHTGTVAEADSNLARYFASIDVDRFDRTQPIPQTKLRRSMVLRGELERLPPEIASDLWMSALFGAPLPRSLLAAVVTRNRAEQHVPPERAALLQFYFRNNARKPHNQADQPEEEKVPPMSLDRTCTDKPYLLGRLLAVLENVQTAAQPQGLNRTIVDRFFGAASTRPGVVFPQLLQLAQHHMAKAAKSSPGRAINLDKQLGEIVDGLNANEGFGSTLSLEDQGRFAIGYYHQRQSFFRKGDAKSETSNLEQGEKTA